MENKKIFFEKFAKVVKTKNAEEAAISLYENESDYLYFKLWEKGQYKRVYVNDYKRRTVAYIDCKTGNVVTEYSDKSEIYQTCLFFKKNYTF